VVLSQERSWFLVVVARNFTARRVPFHSPDDIGRILHIFTKSGPRNGHRGVNLEFRCAAESVRWVREPNAIANAISYAKFRSRSHEAGIRGYDEADNVIENARARWAISKWCEARQTKSRHAVKRDG